MSIEWRNPPAPAPRRVDLVAAELRTKPSEWARIATARPMIDVFGWYYQLGEDFEVKRVPVNPEDRYGAHDVYARYFPPRCPPPGPGSTSRSVSPS